MIVQTISRKATKRLVDRLNLTVSSELANRLESKAEFVPCSASDAAILRQAVKPQPTTSYDVWLVVGRDGYWPDTVTVDGETVPFEQGYVSEKGRCLASCTSRREAEELASSPAGRAVKARVVPAKSSELSKVVEWRKHREVANFSRNIGDQGVSTRPNSVMRVGGSAMTLRENQNRMAEVLSVLQPAVEAHKENKPLSSLSVADVFDKATLSLREIAKKWAKVCKGGDNKAKEVTRRRLHNLIVRKSYCIELTTEGGFRYY